jgi:hypothetical protein
MATTTLQESVKQKAYEFYLKRGGKHGNDQEDWFKAEQEVLQSKNKPNGKKRNDFKYQAA